MSLFRGEKVDNPQLLESIIIASPANTTISSAIIDATGQLSYGTTVAGVTLTAGDVPLFAWKDKDGTPHVAVFRDSDDTIVTRS